MIPQWMRGVLLSAVASAIMAFGTWQCARSERRMTQQDARIDTLVAQQASQAEQLARLTTAMRFLEQHVERTAGILIQRYTSPRGSEAGP